MMQLGVILVIDLLKRTRATPVHSLRVSEVNKEFDELVSIMAAKKQDTTSPKTRIRLYMLYAK